MFSTSDASRLTTYLAGSSSAPFHTMGPATAGASLSELVVAEEPLCRLSTEEPALRLRVDMMNSQQGKIKSWYVGSELLEILYVLI